jgi:hypothetical protein
LLLAFLREAEHECASHQEEQGSENQHDKIGAEEQQLFAEGNEGKGNAILCILLFVSDFGSLLS